MAPVAVTSVLLKNVVKKGYPSPEQDFEVKRSELDLDSADLKGGVLVKVLYVSVDPYMRAKLTGIFTYTPPYVPGEPIYSEAVARVIRSETDTYPTDSLIVGYFRWQTYTVVPGKIIQGETFNRVPDGYKLPLSAWIGPAGMPGRTAYHGLLMADPKPGETIYISAASGAVGAIVGSLALAKGLRVIGSAGSDDKVKFLIDELGFDPASFNYKKVRTKDALRPWLASIKKGQGLDIYFDNVGGQMLDDCLLVSANFARFIICGEVSQLNIPNPRERYGLQNTWAIITRRIRVEGFIVSDDHERRLKDFYAEVPKLLADGKVKWRETRTNGVENGPQALLDMLQGKNFGKAVVVVDENEM